MTLKPEMRDAPRGLADEAARMERRASLEAPHMSALREYVEDLRGRGLGMAPDFDPFDGGCEARALFLLEKPGPMTDPGRERRIGSGFISRDNDDPSAEAVHRFMDSAGWDRRDTILWNLIPWWNGQVKVTAAEKRQGLAALEGLLDRLPRLEIAILVGGKARAARPLLESRGLHIYECAHPSARVRNRWPEKWAAIGETWRLARESLPPREERPSAPA